MREGLRKSDTFLTHFVRDRHGEEGVWPREQRGAAHAAVPLPRGHRHRIGAILMLLSLFGTVEQSKVSELIIVFSREKKGLLKNEKVVDLN